jgi:hypothetical protein
MKGRSMKYAGMLYMLAAMFGVYGSEKAEYIKSNPDQNPLKGIDLDKEYKLIQQKKSKLTRASREFIIYAYDNKEALRKRGEEVLKAEQEEKKKIDKENAKLLKKENKKNEIVKDKENKLV